MLGIPRDVGEATRIAVEGEGRLLDVAEADGTPYMGIASLGFDSDANRIANEAKLVRGDAVYLYAALRALAAWKPASFSVTVDGERHDVSGYSVAVGNSKAYGGGMYLLPHAELDDGQLDVLITKRCPKLTFLRSLPRVFKGTHLDSPYVELLRGEAVEVASDRPFVVYADGDPIGATPGDHAGGAPLPSRDRPSQRQLMFRLARILARLTRGVTRRSGRSGGTTAPGRLMLRLSPDALARMSAELQSGSVLLSATNGKTTTAAMVAAALERDGRRVVHNRAGSNMAWGVATALLDAGTEPGQLGLFEVDEAWLPRVARGVPPRLLLLANLFRDQLDRYGELELLADRWAGTVAELDGRAGFVLNADDPLVADLGRGRRQVTYFGLEDDSQALPGLQHAADSKHCRNCGAPYVYDAVYLGHLGRYRCPNCGRERPRPQVAATRVRLEGMAGLGDRGAHAAGRAHRPAAAPGALQRLQRGGGGGDRARAGRAARRRGRGPGRVRRCVRPGGDHPRRRQPALDSPHQESRGCERGPAHPHAGGRPRSTSGSPSTTASRTAGTCPGSGTPTSRSSRAGCGAPPAPAHGPRRWRCG